MAATWDTSKYLALFVSEAGEHVQALSREIVQLEQEPTPALVDGLFRHAHSVKGMASSMGFTATATLAHRLEDWLAAQRSAPSVVDKAALNAVLAAVDALESHVRAAEAQQPFPDVSAAQAALEALPLAAPPPPSAPLPPVPVGSRPSSPALSVPSPVPSAPPPPATTVPLAPPPPPLPLGPPRHAVTLRVSATSNQPGVRGFLAYKRATSLGNVFDVRPPLDDMKAGRLADGQVRFTLETSAPEGEIRRTLSAIADVVLETLEPLEAQPAAPLPVPKPSAPVDEAPRPLGNEPARTVRIRTELLDQFLDTASELLLATARVRESTKTVPEAQRAAMDDAVDLLHGLVRSLHEKVMTARMTPISAVTDRLPRAARDIAQRRGRDVELLITGADIELDRAIVDQLADPVLHLLRNAIDHGVEPPEERRMRGKDPRGKVSLSVRRVRDRVLLDVEDDGRGIDAERLKALAVERGLLTVDDAKALPERDALLLCCLPGLSTAAAVTDISGRGVGMDAVKRSVEAVGGMLDIESTRGKGARFRLSLPLTVAMVRLLLVQAGDDVFGLPLARISGVVEARPEELASSDASKVLHFGAGVVPVYELSALVGADAAPAAPGALPYVVVEVDEGRVALAVQRLLGQEEVVLKALVRPLDLVPGLAGVTILGSGRPVFVLDAARLVSA